MKDEEGSKAGKDRLQCQEDGGVSGRKVLLCPALDGEGRGSCDQTGDGKSDQQARREIQMRLPSHGKR